MSIYSIHAAPSGDLKMAMENEKKKLDCTYWTWSFSMAMLDYQRVISLRNGWFSNVIPRESPLTSTDIDPARQGLED